MRKSAHNDLVRQFALFFFFVRLRVPHMIACRCAQTHTTEALSTLLRLTHQSHQQKRTKNPFTHILYYL